MQNDERDERDLPPDDSSQPSSDDAAEEFETPSWPTQDTPAAAETAAEAADDEERSAESEIADSQPAASEPAASGQTASFADPEAEDGTEREAEDHPAAPESGPPPQEVEAYNATGEATTAAAGAMPAHSVPATTEPGESTRCPRCGTENRPGIAFCQNCGQRLIAAGAPATVERPAAPDGTQACPRCGTHNRAGVAFCQNCGANLQAREPDNEPVPAVQPATAGHAILGPVVLLIGALGIATAWVLPFAIGNGSLYDQAFGDPSGYGVGFWSAYGGISGLAAQAYFGFAAPAPMLVLLLAALAIGGMMRAQPGVIQLLGLVAALAWAVGLVAMFVVVEVLGGLGGDLLQMLAALSPGGIIFALASLIVVIGCLTRFGRG